MAGHWSGHSTKGSAPQVVLRKVLLEGSGWLDDPTLSSQVTGLSVTSGRDQLVVLHAQGHDDLVVCLHRSQPPLDNRIGELVGMLAAHCQG